MKPIALALLLLQAAPAGQENPLVPMAAVAKAMDARMAAFISGKKAAEAFLNDRTDERTEKIVRDGIEGSKVATAETLLIETEVYLLKEDRATYRITVLFAMQEGTPRPIGFRGGKDAGLRCKPVADYDGDLAPLGDMATRVVALLSGEGWKNIAWADPEVFRKRDPDAPFLAELESELKRGKEGIAELAGRVASIKPDGLGIGLDDHMYIARSADGRLVGTITADFTTRAGKPVSYALGNFHKPDKK